MSDSGVAVSAPVSSLPPLLVALRAIGASALAPPEKALLRALLEWWNHKTGELWPSVPTIAESTGFSLRGVRKILRRLEELGALGIVEASRGGPCGTRLRVTHVYRIQFDRFPARGQAPAPKRARRPKVASPEPGSAPCSVLRPVSQPPAPALPPVSPEPRSAPEAFSPEPCSSLNASGPEPRSGLQPVNCARHPERRDVQPGTGAQRSPEPGSAKHTTHEHTRGTIQAETALQDVFHKLEGWVDGKSKDPRDLRVALIRLGVRGPNLERLSASPALGVEEVLKEARDIQRDPATRNVAAVLVKRLAVKAGIDLMRRPLLDSKSMEVVAKIEAMRRRMRAEEHEEAA